MIFIKVALQFDFEIYFADRRGQRRGQSAWGQPEVIGEIQFLIKIPIIFIVQGFKDQPLVCSFLYRSISFQQMKYIL